MDWRYQMAHRLAFVSLIIAVVMMILLPWPKREVEPEIPESEIEQ
jgi:hypothetical protein